MRNAGLDEAQAGIKIAGRNINNLRHADDTTLLAESEELKSLWWGWKRRVKKLAENSTFKNLGTWNPVGSQYGKQERKKWEQWQILFSWAPKSLWTVTEAMKLADTCSLEGKLRLCVVVAQLCSTLRDPWTVAHRLLCPWNSSGKNPGVGCHLLLQGIFPSQGWNLHLRQWQADSLPLSHRGSHLFNINVSLPFV